MILFPTLQLYRLKPDSIGVFAEDAGVCSIFDFMSVETPTAAFVVPPLLTAALPLFPLFPAVGTSGDLGPVPEIKGVVGTVADTAVIRGRQPNDNRLSSFDVPVAPVFEDDGTRKGSGNK